jgi:hypothetical protein
MSDIIIIIIIIIYIYLALNAEMLFMGVSWYSSESL